VHGVAATHGGTVTLESAPGEGTSVRVYFPATALALGSETPHEGSPVLQTSSISSKVPHVIYVDDEAPQVRAITMLFERDGCRATGYSDPFEALAALRRDPSAVDVVVTDFNMPGTSGLLFAREAMRLRPDLPVVIVSGNVTEGLRSEAKRAGVRQVIHKALVDEIRSAVRRLCRPGAGEADDGGAETVG
jgi:CheY-like chemotaxis protein